MKTYTIKEFSALFDIPASTLRYYEDLSLLENVSRDENNQRIYTDEHLHKMYAINCFKNTGMPLSRIQDFFRYEKNIEENIDNIVGLITNHELDIINQIEKLQQNLEHIKAKTRYYNGIKKAIETGSEWPCFGE